MKVKASLFLLLPEPSISGNSPFHPCSVFFFFLFFFQPSLFLRTPLFRPPFSFRSALKMKTPPSKLALSKSLWKSLASPVPLLPYSSSVIRSRTNPISTTTMARWWCEVPPPQDSTLCFSCYAQGVYTYIKIFNIDIRSWREKGNVQFYFFYIVLYIYIIFFVFILFLKISENNFYLFFKTYYLFHFVLNIIFK